jgi:ATP:ADP antiporter, AAA family
MLARPDGPGPTRAADADAGAGVRLWALLGLFFLVVGAIGMLRPIKNAVALDGLGGTHFYQVYLISAVVVFFVPLYLRVADRISFRALVPALAVFFALNLVAFRAFYASGSSLFGIVFYGWYDLFAAALVTQFFMATQYFVDSRSAKRLYPLVIAGGAVGATAGGAVTGLFAESFGVPNLMLVAAAIIVLFGVGVALVWRPEYGRAPRTARPELAGSLAELRFVLANRQVRLIAASVLLTILVKQLIDYQFNALSYEVYGTAEAVSAFQGRFNAATQWLPLVALAGLRPALRRWGVGLAILLLPVAIFGSAVALAATFGLWAAIAAKAADTSLRYSVDRAGREILYVPVPDDVKLKAKAYIDVAVEKGLGKVGAFLLLGALVGVLGMTYRQTAYVTVVLAAAWVLAALALRREYVRTLARSIEGRFASFRGVYGSLAEASALPILRRTLTERSAARIAFGLELLGQLPVDELLVLRDEINALLDHASPDIRQAALTQMLRNPSLAEEQRLQQVIEDPVREVREAAVRLLLARAGTHAPVLLRGLLADPRRDVRTAALSCIGREDADAASRAIGREYLESRFEQGRAGDAETRAELALAAAGLRGEADAGHFLDGFLEDPDPRVLAVALRSAALLGRAEACDRMIAALGDPAARGAAREALMELGEAAVEPLARTLLDEAAPLRVRHAIPALLARIPAQTTVLALLRLILAPETDELLDARAVRALSKLRARFPRLDFDADLVREVAMREHDYAHRYWRTRQWLLANGSGGRFDELFRRSLEEAWRDRREGVFRCLGMVYDPEGMYRSHAALVGGTAAQRANALEWVEQTIGSTGFRRLAAVLEPETAHPRSPLDPTRLARDNDRWIAQLVRARSAGAAWGDRSADMELIEKVLLLRQVDLLRDAPGSHLALLASIAEEVELPEGRTILTRGGPTQAMFVVTDGAVELSAVGEKVRVEAESAFGTWALIDAEPSPLDARTLAPTRLLRISRSDFHDLLADHSELALGLMQGLARRMRALVA